MITTKVKQPLLKYYPLRKSFRLYLFTEIYYFFRKIDLKTSIQSSSLLPFSLPTISYCACFLLSILSLVVQNSGKEMGWDTSPSEKKGLIFECRDRTILCRIVSVVGTSQSPVKWGALQSAMKILERLRAGSCTSVLNDRLGYQQW